MQQVHSYWYVAPEDRDANWFFVEKTSLEALENWNKKDLMVSEVFMPILKEIVATPPDAYGNGSDYISIPCQITLKDGWVFETALLQLQYLPPFYASEHIILIDEVAKIEPSKYALPLDIRVATALAFEVRMSYAPTVIENGGYSFILNWTNNFFKHPELDAKNTRVLLPEEEENKTKTGKNKNKKEDNNLKQGILDCDYEVVYVIGDWNEELKNLLQIDDETTML